MPAPLKLTLSDYDLLAELAGLHRNYVSSVERGERNISLLNIDKLAKALDVPAGQLLA